MIFFTSSLLACGLTLLYLAYSWSHTSLVVVVVTALVKGVSLKGTLARKMLYYEDSKLRRRKESFSMRSRAI
jgi:hypothetical protein